jgi:hypothetical protein
MSPTSPASGEPRPAAAVNKDIRALWRDPRVRLTAEGSARYERLVTEWAAAIRAEVVEAA